MKGNFPKKTADGLWARVRESILTSTYIRVTEFRNNLSHGVMRSIFVSAFIEIRRQTPERSVHDITVFYH
jgi:hypothetical protein